MLDSFLKVACGRAQKAEEQAQLVDTMRKLPEELLLKIASGEEKLSYIGSCGDLGGGGSWLDKFKGTPLLAQAIELEKQDLQEQMAEQSRYREEDQARSARNAARDQLSVERKLLELQLAEHESGGAAEPQAFAGQETPEEEALEHGAGSPEVQAAAQQPAAPAAAAPAAPKEEPAEKAAMKLAFAKIKMSSWSPREGAKEIYEGAAQSHKSPNAKSVMEVGDPQIAEEATHWTDTASDMQQNPGKYRLRRGVAGAAVGGLGGAALGSLGGRPGIGAAIGAGLGGLGGALAPVSGDKAMGYAQGLQSLSPEERHYLAMRVLENQDNYGLDKGSEARASARMAKTAEEQTSAQMRKVAIGLGMLGKTIGAGASTLGKGVAGAYQTSRAFGGSVPDAARMAFGSLKGQAPGVMSTVGKAVKSYAGANPMQAAALAGGAGLVAGHALSRGQQQQ